MKFWERIKTYLFWLTIFALPWQIRHTFVFAEHLGQFFEHASISLYLTDILIILLLIAWALSVNWRKYKFHWGPIWISAPLGAMIAWMWVSLLWSIDLTVASWAAGHFLLFGLFYLYLVNNVKKIHQILYPLLWGIALQGCLAIAQYFTNHSLGLWWLGESVLDPSSPGIPRVMFGDTVQLRSHGTLPHANILGGYLAIGLALITPLLFKVRSMAGRWGVGVVYALGLAGLVLSLSRSAWAVWIIAVGALVAYLATRLSRQIVRGFRAGLWIVIVVVLLIATQWGVVSSRFDFSNPLERQSINTRAEQFTQFSEVYRSSPLVGVGIGQYQLALRDLDKNTLGWRYDKEVGGWIYSMGQTVWQFEPVHNIFLMILADLGVVGLILFVLLIIGMIWSLVKSIRRKIKLPIMVGLVMIAATMALGLMDHYLWTLQPGRLLLFLVIGLVAVLITYSGYNKNDGSRNS